MVSLNLTKVECYVLYNKYISNGLSPYEAKEKIDMIKKHLKDLVLKLKKRNKSDEEISDRFRKEFEKLCQKLEV